MTEFTAKAKVGHPAPYFKMKTTADLETLEATVSLDDFHGKWLVLFFYPYDFSFVCPTEIRALSARYEDFVDLDAEILGVSVDSMFTHRAWLKTPVEENGIAGIKYHLASDITRQVSRDYGVLDEEEGVALRGLFIIDPLGTLQYSVVHNMDVGRSVEETLRVIEALQAGGMCGADWHHGDETL
jgi:peroxiredoxin (alkyl hydroperoxide reductase subunit C)